MTSLNFPGAKWWKFDFHAHTPASIDFMQGVEKCKILEVTPELWLKKFMEKKIDCVAITDHNTGKWIDKLKAEYVQLENEKPPWFRELHLFPGVEISVSGGVHLLAILGKDMESSDIDQLLGAVGYQDSGGQTDSETAKSLKEVTEAIDKRNGIAIPAHVNTVKGLFKTLSGASLKQVLQNPYVYAMELCDCQYRKPQMYEELKVNWTEICGSDTHNFQSQNFGQFTWVKMEEPSIKGLKLALIDGAPSVNRDMNSDPNYQPNMFIESVTVKSTRFIGRPRELKIEFSPFLNSIIGGRGSGKSSLVEFMRLVLRRSLEIPASLEEDYRKYFNVGSDNLLLDNSRLSIVFSKMQTRYRLNWSSNSAGNSLEVYENGWLPSEGKINSLFPVYIYSQKQIFELANQPHVLLNRIDLDPSVNADQITKTSTDIKFKYKTILSNFRQLQARIGEKDRIKGELNDVERQIEKFEKLEHKKIFSNFGHRQEQITVVDNIEKEWTSQIDSMLDVKKIIEPIQFDQRLFEEDRDIFLLIKEYDNKWMKIKKEFDLLCTSAKTIFDEWYKNKEESEWLQRVQSDSSLYMQMRSSIQQQNLNPSSYDLLLQKREENRRELKVIEDFEGQCKALKDKSEKLLQQLLRNREQLTANRKEFLANILRGNPNVKIELKPFGERWELVESKLRQILDCEDRFERDFESLQINYTENINGFQLLKDTLFEIRQSPEKAKDTRFGLRIQRLNNEKIDELMSWFPEDRLEVKFGNGRNIQQGSPGQKTAALLAFILSYGDEPLILDQPEDDLDNELIYDLIVKQIRTLKNRRQLIIVTHNANIVVNGDSEMIFPLSVKRGQTAIHVKGSLQKHEIREKICSVLEGGQKAFKQRYKRIHL